MSCYTLVEHLLRVHNIASTIERHSSSKSTIKTRQSTKTWIQGQTRLCHLPSPCSTRWKKETIKKGCYIRYVIATHVDTMLTIPGKPTNQGINQLKYQRSLRSTAEERVGKRCANLRVLNSYWINQDSTYKYFEVILVDPSHKAIRRDPRINWIVNPVHKVWFRHPNLCHVANTLSAQRISWSYCHWQEVSWSWKRSWLQSYNCWPKKDLEETQHSQLVEISMSMTSNLQLTTIITSAVLRRMRRTLSSFMQQSGWSDQFLHLFIYGNIS